jgi:hypothetical protein
MDSDGTLGRELAADPTFARRRVYHGGMVSQRRHGDNVGVATPARTRRFKPCVDLNS